MLPHRTEFSNKVGFCGLLWAFVGFHRLFDGSKADKSLRAGEKSHVRIDFRRLFVAPARQVTRKIGAQRRIITSPPALGSLGSTM
jgi:hypothetical protein